MQAPAGTAQPIIDKVYKETIAVIAQPDVKQKLESLGLQLVGNTPAEFSGLIKTETESWGRVIKAAGIKPTQ